MAMDYMDPNTGNIYRLTDAIDDGDRMRHYYRVHCECGTIKIVQRGQFTSEIVHSCGCGRRGKW